MPMVWLPRLPGWSPILTYVVDWRKPAVRSYWSISIWTEWSMRLKTPFKRSWPALTATQSCKKLSVRILFLTNFYPPYQFGGQEQSCQQVVEGLKQRGHATLVLTSMYGTNNTPKEAGGISRSLY